MGILTLLNSCVEAFDPDINVQDPLPLVIEGNVTTEDVPYNIAVRRARPINQTGSTPVSGALVTIIDDQSNSYTLKENFPGNYQTSAFVGEIGRSYMVRVELDGQVIESAFEEILPAFPITSTDAEFFYEDIQSETGEVTTEPRVRIFSDLTYPENQDYYSMFEWEATYQVMTPLQGSSTCWQNPEEAPSDPDPDKNCYITERSTNYIRLFTNERLSGSSIDAYEIYRTTAVNTFQIRYSPLIRQFSLSERAYEFYEQIRQLTENTGSLFDVPPTPIEGNLTNLTNTNEPVLGYFSASDVSEFRTFLPSSLVTGINHWEAECRITPGDGITPPIPPPISCCECTFLPNSSDQVPEFWIP